MHDQMTEALRAILNSDAGRQVLLKLADGQGVNTDEGKAWLHASQLVQAHTASTVEAAREKAHEALNGAERAWHAYASMLDVGPERIHAFNVFENVRQARRA